MKFGEIYEILKEGGFVTRNSWNGTFLWMKQKANVKSEWCKDPILKMLADANGGSVEAEQVVCKYSMEEHKVVTGWIPQQEDMAADDWTDCYVKIDNDELVMKVYKKAETKKSNSDFIGDLFENAEVFKKP